MSAPAERPSLLQASALDANEGDADRSPVVLVIEGAAGHNQALSDALTEEALKIRSVGVDDDVFGAITSVGPNVILIDAFDVDSGIELCSELRTFELSRHLPIVLASANDPSEDIVARGLLAGADDWVGMRGRWLELRARIHVQLRNKRDKDLVRRLRSERDQFHRAATLDALTGVPNRGSLETHLASLWQRGTTFAVLFVDIDRFKTINDRFGHDVGDQVLRATAERLRSGIRPSDFLGRYGGEEFVVALGEFGGDPATVIAVAERHRNAFQNMRLSRLGTDERISVSIGAAVFDPTLPDPALEDLLHRADVALYDAKRSGRDRVVLASQARPDEVPRSKHLPSFSPVQEPSDQEDK